MVKVPHADAPPLYQKSKRNIQKRLTLAKSYEDEADEIMVWAGWYWRLGFTEDANKQRKMAEDRYSHAKKLRNEQ